MADYLNYKWYLKEDGKKEVKSTFMNAVKHYQDLGLDAPKKILDVGCANGEFLSYLKNAYPGSSLTGVDVFPELIEKSKKVVPEADIVLAGVPNLKKILKNKYDLVFGIGLLGIFDDPGYVLEDLLSMTNKGGSLILLSNFNEHPVDVKIDFRKKTGGAWSDWQKGWNIFSVDSMEELLKDKVQSLKFIDFEAPFEIQPNPEDPIRSWTRDVNGKLELTNGICLAITFKYLIIIK
jgi:trans-aconitate methyltransferase